jgi:hypothetical protein
MIGEAMADTAVGQNFLSNRLDATTRLYVNTLHSAPESALRRTYR